MEDFKFNNIDEIKTWLDKIQAFDSNGKLTSKASLNLRKMPIAINSIKNLLNLDSDNVSELLYNIYNENCNKFCEVCGNPVKFLGFTSGYRKTCSKNCANILTVNEGYNTKLEKYGDSKYNNSNKTKNTKLEKYGNSSYVNPEKAKNTKLERYGSSTYNNIDKAKETNRYKYGVDYVFKNKDVKEKIKRSLNDHYGVNSPMQSDKIKKVYTDNFKINHGCNWPQQNPEIHKKQCGRRGMSSPENKLYNFLKNRNFNFLYEYSINGKNFDFAIFNNNKLSLLVEIDGEYYHGLTSDYDGKHVRGDSDHERFLKYPDGVKFIACDSTNIEKCFDEILSIYNISYDEWINSVIDSLPKSFPYPDYSEKRLRSDYKKLCEYNYNSYQKLGISTINNFHKSIWKAHIKNLPSPYEAWENKELLKKCVKNRFIYSSKLSSQNILNGFSVCKIAPRVSLFNPSYAKYLILKYLSNYNEIFDPFSGFSGRLLGACSLNKRYIGQDINKDHVHESNQIIEFHNLNAIVIQKDILNSEGTYECLFTCPPYSGKEHWNIKNDEIEKTCDEWIGECLNRFICSQYLFVVDNTEKYKDYIVEIKENKSHFGKNEEKVILIKNRTL